MVDLNHWLAALVGELERPMLSVLLDILIIVISTNHSLGVKDSVGRVGSSLILCCVSDQSFVFSECDPRWGNSISLIIGDDLDFSTSLNTEYCQLGPEGTENRSLRDTRIGSTQINTDNSSIILLFCRLVICLD